MLSKQILTLRKMQFTETKDGVRNRTNILGGIMLPTDQSCFPYFIFIIPKRIKRMKRNTLNY